MEKLRFTFEKGGSIDAILNNNAPISVSSLLQILPIETTVFHTRWCGREISAAIKTLNPPPKEKCTTIVSKFDVAYWRDWDGVVDNSESPIKEAIAIYYGAEMLRYHNGFLSTNIIGRITVEQEKQLDSIGLRIWQYGIEKVIIERL